MLWAARSPIGWLVVSAQRFGSTGCTNADRSLQDGLMEPPSK